MEIHKLHFGGVIGKPPPIFLNKKFSLLYGRSTWYGRCPCVGVDWIGLYGMAGACGMAGGGVWWLIGSGCMKW